MSNDRGDFRNLFSLILGARGSFLTVLSLNLYKIMEEYEEPVPHLVLTIEEVQLLLRIHLSIDVL